MYQSMVQSITNEIKKLIYFQICQLELNWNKKHFNIPIAVLNMNLNPDYLLYVQSMMYLYFHDQG